MKRLLLALAAASFVSSCSTFGIDNSGSAVPSSFAQGFEAIKFGDYARAEPLLLNALAAQPNDPYTLLALGVVATNTGRRAEAESYYRRAAEFGGAAPVGEITGIDPFTGRQLKTVRDVALFNLAQYGSQPQPIDFQTQTSPVYETIPSYDVAPPLTYDTTPIYQPEPATTITYDSTPVAPVYQPEPATITTYDPAPSYTVTPSYDTAVPTLGGPLPEYGVVPGYGETIGGF